MKAKIYLLLTFNAFFAVGQEADTPDCSEPVIREIYNLRMAIIKKQKLDIWPDLIEIKKLSEIRNTRNDSLVLYTYYNEYEDVEKLRISNTADLSQFAEMDYPDDCHEEGTIATDLRFGKINTAKMKAEIYCREKKYAVLQIKSK